MGRSIRQLDSEPRLGCGGGGTGFLFSPRKWRTPKIARNNTTIHGRNDRPATRCVERAALAA